MNHATTALLALTLAACLQPNSPTQTAPDAATVAPAVVAAAWPSTVRAGRSDKPKIGMQALSRQRDWPLLRRARRGEVLPRDPSFSPAREPRELQILGEQVYATYCRGCHGVGGRGDGPMAARMNPRPRDLVRGEYRFRTTPYGQPPTLLDLFRVVTGGLHGTQMNAFADLPEEQRWAVSEYLRTLSPAFATAVTGTEPPEPPADLDTPKRRTRGAAVYARLGCAACHGDGGAGGVTSPTVKAPALTRTRFKRGREPGGLYATVTTGLNGTPMVGLASATPADDVWSLVAWLRGVNRR